MYLVVVMALILVEVGLQSSEEKMTLRWWPEAVKCHLFFPFILARFASMSRAALSANTRSHHRRYDSAASKSVCR